MAILEFAVDLTANLKKRRILDALDVFGSRLTFIDLTRGQADFQDFELRAAAHGAGHVFFDVVRFEQLSGKRRDDGRHGSRSAENAPRRGRHSEHLGSQAVNGCPPTAGTAVRAALNVPPKIVMLTSRRLRGNSDVMNFSTCSRLLRILLNRSLVDSAGCTCAIQAP